MCKQVQASITIFGLLIVLTPIVLGCTELPGPPLLSITSLSRPLVFFLVLFRDSPTTLDDELKIP